MKIVLHFYFLLFLCTAAASQTQIAPKIAAVPNAHIHILPEQYPEFKGGEKALIEFVQKNLVYATTHADTTFNGKTIIRFVVMEDGKVDSVTVKRSCGRKNLDAEAIRVISILPDFIPGKTNGKPVACPYLLPVIFSR
jgi:TonB family protein